MKHYDLLKKYEGRYCRYSDESFLGKNISIVLDSKFEFLTRSYMDRKIIGVNEDSVVLEQSLSDPTVRVITVIPFSILVLQEVVHLTD